MNQPRQPVAPLAARQRDVLRLIQRYYDASGEPPTVRYLARRLNIHHTTVVDHLVALCRKGWLRTPTPDGIRCLHSEANT